MIRKLKRAFLLLAALFAVGSVTAYTPVVNEVTVDSSGSLSQNPVLLHQATFANWLADPDYTKWREYYDYPSGGGTPCDYPMITKITYGGQSQFFTNLYPGVQHEYNVGGKSGTFTPASEPPRTLLAPVYGTSDFVTNFRDLGGWRLEGSSKRTNYDVFFRSANWDSYFRSTDRRAGNPMNRVFGIKSEIELRAFSNAGASASDVAKIMYGGSSYDEDIFNEVYHFTEATGPYAKDSTFTNSPSLPAGDTSVRYFQCPWIAEFITDSHWGGAKELVRTFKVLAQQRYRPVVFHCAGGRDRTGYLAFLIEALCGVHLDDIYRDHLAIILADKGEIQRADGYIEGLYSSDSYKSSEYGDSLAGRTRKYLQVLGASDDDLKAVIEAYTGETAAQVLSRVNAHEAANHYRTITYKKGSETVAVYRVGDDTLYREPEVPSGYTAWSAEDANGVRTAVNSATYAATFMNGEATFATQSSTTQATKPSPDPTKSGYTFRGWKVNGSGNVVSFPYTLSANTTFVAYFEQQSTPSSDGRLATGGDYVHKENIGGTDYWIHEFSNGTARVFENISGASLEVQYLVVGGGGAGGSSKLVNTAAGWGGGGGAGGQVVDGSETVAAEGSLSVIVGAGGKSSAGGQSSIVGVATASGGAAGSACSDGGKGGSGTDYSGGNGGSYKFSSSAENCVAGGGAGAAENGENGTIGTVSNGTASGFKSGNGGVGKSSSIKSEEAEYFGGGGGGGGGRRLARKDYFGTDGITPGNGGNGGGGNGGSFSVPAANGLAGTGGGGGGAGGQCNVDVSSGDSLPGGDGGDGIVIIRYVAPASYTATFTSEGATFATQANVTEATEPSPEPTKSGYNFVGWKVGGAGNVVTFPYTLTADTTFDAYFEQQVTPGPTPSGDALAEGGDYVHKENIGGTDYWIHEFSNGTVNVTFQNTSGESLEVEYLVVGGGGAGGDGVKTYGGGGGGGGGGVVGNTTTIAANTTWNITVGAGGTRGDTIKADRVAATASSICIGSADPFVSAPGGGAGACCTVCGAIVGAAGGGGCARTNGNRHPGASGNFGSVIDGTPTDEGYSGGTGVSKDGAANSDNGRGAGGGGGAAGPGGPGRRAAGHLRGDAAPRALYLGGRRGA